MRSIAILNQKGGVGKTTTAVNVAAALAARGRQVLLIDMDPQAHASMHVGIEVSEEGQSVYDLLIGEASVLEAVQSLNQRLMVLPAHLDLVGAEQEISGREEREILLASAIAPLLDELQYCVIDCAPSLGLLTVNALAATNEVIIPLQPHFLALQGLGKLLETVTLVRDNINPALRVSGVVFTMFETNTRLAQEVERDVRDFVAQADVNDAWYGARVFETRIRRNIKLAECPSFGQDIFTYAANSHGAVDYLALAQEIEAMPEPEVIAAQEASADEVGSDAAPPLPAEEAAGAEADEPVRETPAS